MRDDFSPADMAESLARQFRGDLVAVARRIYGMQVSVVPAAELARIRGRFVRGSTDGTHTILIADSEMGEDFTATLGHEVAHVVDSSWSEAQCDEFSREFAAAVEHNHRAWSRP